MKFFFWKSTFLYHFRTFGKLIRPSGKNSQVKFSKWLSKCPWENIEETMFLKNFLYKKHFWTLFDNFSNICRKLLNGVAETSLYLSIASPWGELFFLRKIPPILDRFVVLCEKISNRVVETAFYCLEEQFDQIFFLEKKVSYFSRLSGKKVPLLSFSDIERKLLGFLSKKLRRVCQNYFLPCRGTFWY